MRALLKRQPVSHLTALLLLMRLPRVLQPLNPVHARAAGRRSGHGAAHIPGPDGR